MSGALRGRQDNNVEVGGGQGVPFTLSGNLLLLDRGITEVTI